MRSLTTPSALVALAIALAAAAPAPSLADGSSLGGVRGLLRVQSADPHPVGYLAGTVFGSYARVQYEPAESPRARAETVKFGRSALTVAYAPSTWVEMAFHGTAEGQFLRSEAAGVSESRWGMGNLGLGVKTLLTPGPQRDFRLAAGLDVAAATGSTDALAGSWDSDGFDITGRLALTYAHGAAAEREGLRAHLNTGWLNRTGAFDEAAWALTASGPTPGTSVLHGDQFLYGAGLEFPAARGWTLFAEWSGEYDVDAGADFSDNPMRITPGVRWSAPGGTIVWTSGADLSLASEEAGPSWGLVAGLTFAGHLTPVSGTLTGVVRDAQTGAPIANARIVRRNGGAEAVTDADGRFRADLDKGYAVLEISAEGYVSKTRVVEITGHRQDEFDFTLPKRNIYGSLQGHLRDATTGAPLAGRVRVRDGSDWVETDAATGAWEIAKVAEGKAVVEFEAGGHRSATADVRIAAGDLTIHDATLEADPKADWAALTGEVRDAATGRPVTAVVIARGRTTVTANADAATGRYALRLEAGTYEVSVTGEGYASRSDSVRVASRDAYRLDWELATAPREMTLHGVLFDPGGATIKRESLTALGEAARFLAENPGLEVVIEGHTDDTGSPESNRSLSQRRADAVMKYLVVNHGVDPARLSAKGMGATDPIAPNDTEENRAKNRRIELVVREAGAR